jgi:peptide/nickel transport system ATP-binding protein
MASPRAENLVEVRDLAVTFAAERPVHAVNGLSLDLAAGEVLGVLGESGSGKSVTLRALLRILPARRTRISGSIRVAGRDVLALEGKGLEDYRGGVVSMIFQEPMLAFDPVFTIGEQIAESVVRHTGADRARARARALEMLEHVRIPSARRRLDAYPHEMSGGMRQRAMIALALACGPKLLLADEPTTALDATVQIQILLLLRELQRELGMSVIFVTHDVGVACEVADRIAVMYAGRIVESGAARDVVKDPRHPYTAGLLASIVRGELRGKRINAIPGSPPDLSALPAGCSFAPRCRLARADCHTAQPAARELAGARSVRCVLAAEDTS